MDVYYVDRRQPEIIIISTLESGEPTAACKQFEMDLYYWEQEREALRSFTKNKYQSSFYFTVTYCCVIVDDLSSGQHKFVFVYRRSYNLQVAHRMIYIYI